MRKVKNAEGKEKSYPASYDFSDQLIKQAIKDNKMIIIMRARENWFERIEELAAYKNSGNLYFLSSPECGYLTPRNIKNYKTDIRLEEEENYKEIIKKYFKI